ncbi:hypothetical protein Q644_14080 [Brucella intermedia 229E]|uniref:Uncharacterized protein n=1 Tax=Brucella intermedia 229E TaxID=1337887 RepID=U4VD05_9HYPH|nr:hypothetical protein Q644_14080 [Brucella intermedia 229E]
MGGLIALMQAVFPNIAPDRYTPHALHAQTRIWPETNCYVDLWIEVLATLGGALRKPCSASR